MFVTLLTPEKNWKFVKLIVSVYDHKAHQYISFLYSSMNQFTSILDRKKTHFEEKFFFSDSRQKNLIYVLCFDLSF